MRYLFLLPFLIVSTAWGDDFRTFTNEEGNTVEARMVGVERDLAVIQREDRRIFRVPIDSLSDEDQDFVRRWPVLRALEDERNVEIRMRRLRLNRVVEDENPTFVDAVSFRGIREEIAYQIVINNRSLQDITDLTIEYRIFKDLAQHNAKERRGPALRPERVTKSGTLTLRKAEARKETMLLTAPFFLVETVREEWGSYHGGLHHERTVQIRREDELHGIWIRVMDGDQVVRESYSSQNIPRRFSWE